MREPNFRHPQGVRGPANGLTRMEGVRLASDAHGAHTVETDDIDLHRRLMLGNRRSLRKAKHRDHERRRTKKNLPLYAVCVSV